MQISSYFMAEYSPFTKAFKKPALLTVSASLYYTL